MGVTWRRWCPIHAESVSASCLPAEAAAACGENGWICTVGLARVPRVSGAAGRLGESPPLSAHLLSPLSPRYPGLARGAALPGVPHAGGVRRGRAPQQHPPRAPLGRHQATAPEGRTGSGGLHQRDFWSGGQSAQQRSQRPRHSRNTAPESPGKEHPRAGECTPCEPGSLFSPTNRSDLSIKSSLLHYWLHNLSLRLAVIVTNGCDWEQVALKPTNIPLSVEFFPLVNIPCALAYFPTEPSAKVSLALEILAAVLLVNVREKFRVKLQSAALGDEKTRDVSHVVCLSYWSFSTAFKSEVRKILSFSRPPVNLWNVLLPTRFVGRKDEHKVCQNLLPQNICWCLMENYSFVGGSSKFTLHSRIHTLFTEWCWHL